LAGASAGGGSGVDAVTSFAALRAGFLSGGTLGAAGEVPCLGAGVGLGGELVVCSCGPSWTASAGDTNIAGGTFRGGIFRGWADREGLVASRASAADALDVSVGLTFWTRLRGVADVWSSSICQRLVLPVPQCPGLAMIM
jgi:hypothetical protein